MQQPYITLLYAKEKTVQAVPTKVSKKAKTSLIFPRKNTASAMNVGLLDE